MKSVDRTKKSNIKCEHCKFWSGNSGEIDKVCLKKNETKNYWNRCKEFQWRN